MNSVGKARSKSLSSVKVEAAAMVEMMVVKERGEYAAVLV